MRGGVSLISLSILLAPLGDALPWAMVAAGLVGVLWFYEPLAASEMAGFLLIVTGGLLGLGNFSPIKYGYDRMTRLKICGAIPTLRPRATTNRGEIS